MVNVRSQRHNESVLVLVQTFNYCVSVGLVPEHLEVVVPVVSKEHVRLSDKFLVWILCKGPIKPMQHIICHMLRSKVLVERVHAVET